MKLSTMILLGVGAVVLYRVYQKGREEPVTPSALPPECAYEPFASQSPFCRRR